MKTLVIELRWPPRLRFISGRVYNSATCRAGEQAARAHERGVLALDPPPLLVAACAAKARAESARLGWQTRREFRGYLARMAADAKAYRDSLDKQKKGGTE